MSQAPVLHDYVLSGNCYKIRLMAALLGAPLDTRAVDFYPGFEHKRDAFLALNPAGTLPVLDVGGQVLTETFAMLVWLAANHDTSGRWNPLKDAAQVQEWLAFSSRLSATLGQARLWSMLDWKCDGPAAKAEGLKALRLLELALVDREIDGKLWLVGDHPTIADIACFPYTALAPDAGLELDGYPAIRSWLYAIRSLNGFITMPGIHALHELRTND